MRGCRLLQERELLRATSTPARELRKLVMEEPAAADTNLEATMTKAKATLKNT